MGKTSPTLTKRITLESSFPTHCGKTPSNILMQLLGGRMEVIIEHAFATVEFNQYLGSLCILRFNLFRSEGTPRYSIQFDFYFHEIRLLFESPFSLCVQ